MINFKVDFARATLRPILLEDFSDMAGAVALQKIRVEINQFPKATWIYAKLEVRIKCEAI